MQALASLALHYPSSGHNQATIASIVPDFHDALCDLTPGQLAQVRALHLRQSSFFPTIRDLLACKEQLLPHWERERQKRTALPEKPISEEDFARNARKARELLAMLSAKFREQGSPIPTTPRVVPPADANAWEAAWKRIDDVMARDEEKADAEVAP